MIRVENTECLRSKDSDMKQILKCYKNQKSYLKAGAQRSLSTFFKLQEDHCDMSHISNA